MSDVDLAERRAWVANVRAILALPAMQAADRTMVRRAVVVDDAEATIIGAMINGDGHVSIQWWRRGRPDDLTLVLAPDDPLPEWHTELVPA